MPWAEAKTVCENLGGSLLMIRSAAENTAAVNAMTAVSGASNGWIGLNDLDNEGTYVWARNGASPHADAGSYDVDIALGPNDFTAWEASNPNSASSFIDCVELRRDHSDWRVRSCTGQSKNPICEGVAPPSPPTAPGAARAAAVRIARRNPDQHAGSPGRHGLGFK